MNRNIPYRKEYNSDGNIINPITDRYVSVLPNRAERRKKEGRFYGNGKNHHLSVTAMQKFRRIMQTITLKDKSTKVIYHYL